MAYQVIARKCRPQTFEEVIGQKHVTQTLTNALKNERIAHAFLFTGERGVGKTSVARILAKALNCHTGLTASPCGACISCTEITDGHAIDVHEIDGASNTGVDDIRALRESVKYQPARDRYKIYIIDEVHMLSTSAFNALLKTLEEPPGHIVFIFATTEPHKIPDTIISRCLRFDFKRISAREIAKHLETIVGSESVQISSQGLLLIARESEGSMRDAQTILERAISYCGGKITDSGLEELLGHIDRRHVYNIIEAVFSEDAQACMEAFTELYNLGLDLRQFYYSFLEQLRNIMVVKTVKNAAQLIELADEDIKKLTECAERISREQLQQCFRLWFCAEGELLKSAFPKIALEMCLLEMVYIKRSICIDEIVSRIETLQTSLASSVSTSQIKHASAGRPQPSRLEEHNAAGFSQAPAAETPVQEQPAASSDAAAFMAFVRKNHLPTASILEHGSIELGENNEVRILFPMGSFFLDKIKEPDTENRIRQLGVEFFNKDVNLVIEASSKKESSESGEKKLNRKREQDTLHNPIIQKIIKTFNGKIVKINTDI